MAVVKMIKFYTCLHGLGCKIKAGNINQVTTDFDLTDTPTGFQSLNADGIFLLNINHLQKYRFRSSRSTASRTSSTSGT